MNAKVQKAWLSLAGGLTILWIATSGFANRANNLASTAMLASDAKTWATIVPKNDLAAIVKLRSDEIEKATKSNGTFLRGFRKLELTGRLVAMLGNIGTVYMEGDDAKKAAALRQAGLALAESSAAKDFAGAQKAAAVIAAYPASIQPASEATPAKWDDVLDLDVLMKGVSAIDNATRAACRKTGADFESQAESMAAESILLACLSVVAREHGEKDDWFGWCDDMRALSVDLAKKFQTKDPSIAKEGHNALQKACTDCHAVYRPDE